MAIVYRLLRGATVYDVALSDQRDASGGQAPFDFETRAGAAAAAGGYREAIRLTFLGVLRGLHDRGLIKYDPARTNREYLASIRLRDRSLYEAFSQLIALFDRKWYGHEPAHAPDFRVFQEMAAGVAEALRRLQRVPGAEP